jgi:heat shock protein HslJ
MVKLFFLFTTVVFLLSGCGSGSLFDQIVDKQWTVQTINGQTITPKTDESVSDVASMLLKDAVPYIIFTENYEASGSTGCTTFMDGSFTVEENNITIDPKISELGSCPETTEKDFLEALKLVDNARIEDKNLTLLAGDKEVITLLATAKVSIIKQKPKNQDE